MILPSKESNFSKESNIRMELPSKGGNSSEIFQVTLYEHVLSCVLILQLISEVDTVITHILHLKELRQRMVK